MALGKILKELDDVVKRDIEEPSGEDIVRKKADNNDEANISDIMKHIEAVEAAANFIDKMTPGYAGDEAFDAEVALRKALSKMKELSDEVYQDEKEDNE